MDIKFNDNEVIMMHESSMDSNVGSSSTDSTRMSLLIMGDIGGWWGVNANEVYRELQGRDVENIDVYISSPGGSAKDAFTIYNFLKGHKANVTAYLFGECMSAASIIANAAERVVIGRATVYMAHHGATYAYGKSKDLRKVADTIDTYDSIIEDLYVEKTGMTKEQVIQFLDEERYITPEDALELNLVDEVVDAISVDFKVDEEHPNHSSDRWDEWYYYFSNESNQSSPNFAHTSMDIKYMSKSRINKIKNGESLGSYLSDLVDDYAENNDMTRSEVISDAADAAGISSGTVNQIINGSINCPPVERIEGFASFFSVDEDEFYSRGREDGCTIYDDNDTESKGEKIVNMGLLNEIMNFVTGKGYKVVDENNKEVDLNAIEMSKEEISNITNSVVGAALNPLQDKINNLEEKLNKPTDVQEIVDKALEEINNKVSKLEKENKSLKTDLEAKKIDNKKLAKELLKDEEELTNSDNPDIKVKETPVGKQVVFKRDKPEIKAV